MTSILVVASALSGLTLRVAFEPESTVAYRVTQQFRDSDTGDLTEFEDDVRYRVVEVNDLGQAKIETTWKPVALRLDGTDVPLMPDQSATAITEWRSPLGQVRDRTPFPTDDARTRRAARPFELVLPSEAVGPGSTWSVTAASDETGLPAATWKWTLQSQTGDEAVIGFEFNEADVADSVVATGVIRLDSKTGWVTQVDGTAANVMIPGDEERALHVLKFSMRRV